MLDEQINQKLYSWINGIININDPAMRRELIPLWDLINNTLKNGGDEIISTIKVDNRSFRLNIVLDEELNLGLIEKTEIEDDDIEPIVSIDQLEKMKK